MKHLRVLSVTSLSLGAALGASVLLSACGSVVTSDDGADTSGAPPDPLPATCVPAQSSAPVDDSCGVFVSSSLGDDAQSGSKSAPVATLARALQLAEASNGRVYACAEAFAAALALSSGAFIFIYGGLDCAAGWAHAGGGAKTSIAPGPDQVPLTLSGGGTFHLEDIAAKAADAALPSGSSIALIAEIGPTGALELVRSALVAGAGAPGEHGTTPFPSDEPKDPADLQIAGRPGNNACMDGAAGNLGPMGTTNPYCPTSVSGRGGTGQEVMGGNGEAGVPSVDPNPSGFGLGGMGAAGPSGCQDGMKGISGSDGLTGTGASDMGVISLAGYMGTSGTDGASGAPGQGGGGGGAAKGKAFCQGAAGGSGGAGGCGGKGGTGGKAGGSSIALLSLGSAISLSDVTLTSGQGGAGGDGGLGLPGGVGGEGGKGGVPGATGSGTLAACSGGDGGFGGFGGAGGGGRGGHSIGVAYTGPAPVLTGATMSIGSSGPGGASSTAKGSGAGGVASDTIAFF